jgi:hypothetical protein
MREYATAIIAIIIPTLGAIAACITAFAAYRNSRRNGETLVQQQGAIQEIHILTNNRLSMLLERVEQLTQTLESADVTVPPEPNAGDTMRAV